jgi:hypothetical protein
MNIRVFVTNEYMNYIPIYCAYFRGSLSREVAKIGSSKKIKLLYSLVNR